MAQCTDVREADVETQLGSYRPLGLIGEGGWCVVRRAEDPVSGRRVALKTFRDQVRRDAGDDALGARFAAEIAIFETLGLAPAGRPRTPSSRPCLSGPAALDPRRLFVSLLDFSGPSLAMPGPGADGRFWSVLELAEESLEASLQRRLKTREFVDEAWIQEVAASLAAGLHWLQVHDLSHLDVKPANVMRFRDRRWKLIDLEGCTRRGTVVDLACVTPLYTCPEIAKGVLQRDVPGSSDVFSTPQMDIWSVGVVLLDMLAHAAALQETFAAFQCQALMDFDAVDDGGPLSGGKREWYEWLCDKTSFKIEQYMEGVASSKLLLESSSGLSLLLNGLLAKSPEQRLSIADFATHQFIASCNLHVVDDQGPQLSGAPFASCTVEATPSSGAAHVVSSPVVGVVESVIATFQGFIAGKTMEWKHFAALIGAIEPSFAQEDLALLVQASGTCVKGSQIEYGDFLRWLFNSRRS